MILVTGGLGSIGSHTARALPDPVEYLRAETGRPPDNYMDITRLREDTGFRLEYHVERAVPDYVNWLRNHDC